MSDMGTLPFYPADCNSLGLSSNSCDARNGAGDLVLGNRAVA